MKIIVAAGERRQITAEQTYLTVISATDIFEVINDKIGEVSLKQGEQVDLKNSRYISIQNLSVDQVLTVEIEFSSTQRTAQREEVAISKMPAVQVEATVAAAADASDPVTTIIPTGESREILPANANRHSATITRGETDLYNIKLAYKTAANAQIGTPFAPQATATVKVKQSVWAHNHSQVDQTVIVQDTSIDTGA